VQDKRRAEVEEKTYILEGEAEIEDMNKEESRQGL